MLVNAPITDDEEDVFAPEHVPTGHGNRAGARRQAALNPATDTRPAAIALAAKERRAVKLRARGCTFQQIADELGYQSRAAARSTVVRGLQRWMEPAEALRAMELDRAEMLERELVALLKSDDPNVRFKAIDGILRVMDFTAKVTGLYLHRRPKRAKHDPVVDKITRERAEELVAAVQRFRELTGQLNGSSPARGTPPP